MGTRAAARARTARRPRGLRSTGLVTRPEQPHTSRNKAQCKGLAMSEKSLVLRALSWWVKAAELTFAGPAGPASDIPSNIELYRDGAQAMRSAEPASVVAEPPPPSSSGHAHRLRGAKLAAYPRRGVGDWSKEGHSRSHLVEQLWRTVNDSFVRVPGARADISDRLEAAHEPVVFTGLTEGWEAAHWSVEQWVQRFGGEGFKVSSMPKAGRAGARA